VFYSEIFCFILQTSECFSLSVVDLLPFGSCNSLLKRRKLRQKHKQLWTSKVHSDCFIFVVYGSVFTAHRSQQKSEASRKSRTDLEGSTSEKFISS